MNPRRADPRWDIFEHRDEGKVVVLSLDVSGDDSTTAVLEAIANLTCIFQPLSAEVRRHCFFGQDDLLATENHQTGGSEMLVSSGVTWEGDAGFQNTVEAMRMYIGAPEQIVEALTPERIGRWLREPSATCAQDPAHLVSWSELWITSCRARLLSVLPEKGVRVLATERPGNVHTVPVEWVDEEAWVSAPTIALRRSVVGPPFVASVTRDGHVCIKVRVRWSLWTGTLTPERAMLDSVLTSLEKKGWAREEFGQYE